MRVMSEGGEECQVRREEMMLSDVPAMVGGGGVGVGSVGDLGSDLCKALPERRRDLAVHSM